MDEAAPRDKSRTIADIGVAVVTPGKGSWQRYAQPKTTSLLVTCHFDTPLDLYEPCVHTLIK